MGDMNVDALFGPRPILTDRKAWFADVHKDLIDRIKVLEDRVSALEKIVFETKDDE